MSRKCALNNCTLRFVKERDGKYIERGIGPLQIYHGQRRRIQRPKSLPVKIKDNFKLSIANRIPQSNQIVSYTVKSTMRTNGWLWLGSHNKVDVLLEAYNFILGIRAVLDDYGSLDLFHTVYLDRPVT